MNNKKEIIPEYLTDNNWGKELNHKLWITKGARFEANNRLKQKASLSNISLAFISSYIIIINLVPLYFTSINISSEIINFFTTSLSILLLVFTQIESSNEYKLNAHHFHSCSLKISKLYNDFRIIKEIEDKDEKEKKVIEITNEYNKLLPLYENHEPINTAMFKSQKLEYYKLSKLFKIVTYCKYYFLVKFKYHVIIFSPPILFVLLVLFYM